jgi:hypothetical protein
VQRALVRLINHHHTATWVWQRSERCVCVLCVCVWGGVQHSPHSGKRVAWPGHAQTAVVVAPHGTRNTTARAHALQPTRQHTLTHARTHTHAHMHTRTHAHTHTHPHTPTYTHTHAHTHKRTGRHTCMRRGLVR